MNTQEFKYYIDNCIASISDEINELDSKLEKLEAQKEVYESIHFYLVDIIKQEQNEEA
jgi:hypothetical protein